MLSFTVLQMCYGMSEIPKIVFKKFQNFGICKSQEFLFSGIAITSCTWPLKCRSVSSKWW